MESDWGAQEEEPVAETAPPCREPCNSWSELNSAQDPLETVWCTL